MLDVRNKIRAIKPLAASLVCSRCFLVSREQVEIKARAAVSLVTVSRGMKQEKREGVIQRGDKEEEKGNGMFIRG